MSAVRCRFCSLGYEGNDCQQEAECTETIVDPEVDFVMFKCCPRQGIQRCLNTDTLDTENNKTQQVVSGSGSKESKD